MTHSQVLAEPPYSKPMVWSIGFCGGSKTGEPGENPSEQGETNKNPRREYDTGGERSHYCAILAPPEQ